MKFDKIWSGCTCNFTSTVTHSLDSISNLNSLSAIKVISSDLGGTVIFGKVFTSSSNSSENARQNFALIIFNLSTQYMASRSIHSLMRI